LPISPKDACITLNRINRARDTCLVENKKVYNYLTTMNKLLLFLEEIGTRIIEDGYSISREEAERIGQIDSGDALLLFHYAKRIRERLRGDTVGLCSIVNAKSGACSEDCAFCSQSARFKTSAPVFPLLAPEEALKTAHQAVADGAKAFGVVISGKGIKNEKELRHIGEIVKAIKQNTPLDVHASVGIASWEQLEYLRDCGVTMLHHNLETSERFFPSICSTHSYRERIETLRTARECGLKLCSGGIFGLGETLADRIDMAFALRELDVDAVPLNFLCAIAGTPMEKQTPLSPIEILMIIALYRFILPRKEIKICGGRETNLRDLQGMIFFAGADGMMIGNYLTTAGREPMLDWQLMRDLHLNYE